MGRAVVTDRAGQGKQFFIFGCSSKNICNMNSSEHPDTMSTLFFAIVTKKIAT
jgi:hypothetical protein